MITEREHWLRVTSDRDWKRRHIFDPNICPVATVNAITTSFPENPERILEIGCGYGRLAALVKKLYPEATVTGTDINPAIIEHGLPGVTYHRRDNLTGLPEQDAIYSVAVFQHLPDAEKRAYIEQAADILRPGGVLRVQFIAGERDNFCDHWTSWPQILDWFDDAGLDPVAMETGLAHEQWSWITGIK